MRAFAIKYRGVLAYILLATAIAFSIVSVEREQDARIADVRGAAAKVVRQGCDRDVNSASELVDILKGARNRLASYHKQGILTDDQYRVALYENNKAVSRLTIPDCKAIVAEFLESTRP